MGAQQSQEGSEVRLNHGADRIRRLTKGSGEAGIQDDTTGVSNLLGGGKRGGRIWSQSFDVMKKMNDDDIGKAVVRFNIPVNDKNDMDNTQDDTVLAYESMILSRLLNMDIADPLLVLKDLQNMTSEDLKQREDELGHVGIIYIHKHNLGMDFRSKALCEDNVNDVVGFVGAQIRFRQNTEDPEMSDIDASLLPVRVRSAYHEWLESPPKAFNRHCETPFDVDDIDAIIQDFFSVMYMLNKENDLEPTDIGPEESVPADMMSPMEETQRETPDVVVSNTDVIDLDNDVNVKPTVEIVITHDSTEAEDSVIEQIESPRDWTTQEDGIALNRTTVDVHDDEKDCDIQGVTSIHTSDDQRDPFVASYSSETEYADSTISLQRLDNYNQSAMVARVVMSHESGDSAVVIDSQNGETLTRGVVNMNLYDDIDGVGFNAEHQPPGVAFNNEANCSIAPLPMYNSGPTNIPYNAHHNSGDRKNVRKTKNIKPEKLRFNYDKLPPAWRADPFAYPVYQPSQKNHSPSLPYSSTLTSKATSMDTLASATSRVDPMLEGKQVSASTYVHDNALVKVPLVSTMPISIKAPRKPREWETVEKTMALDFD